MSAAQCELTYHLYGPDARTTQDDTVGTERVAVDQYAQHQRDAHNSRVKGDEHNAARTGLDPG